MSFPIDSPLPIFYDRNGDVLDAGYIWLGTVNLNAETNPVPVFWSDGTPAPQPLRTVRGFIARNGAPAQLLVGSDYSLIVRDRDRQLILSLPAALGLSGSGGSDLIGFLGQYSGAVAITAQTKMRQIVHAQDYGILPDSTDYSVQFQQLVNNVSAAGGGEIRLASGTYVMQWEAREGVHVVGATDGHSFTAADQPGTVIQVPVAGGTVWSFPASSPRMLGAGLKKVLLRGRGSATPAVGISMRDCSRVVVEDVGFDNFADEALIAQSGTRISSFHRLFAQNCLLNRTRAANSYVFDLQSGSGDCWWYECEITPSITAGLSSVNKRVRALGVAGDNHWIIDCLPEFADVGVTLYGGAGCLQNKFSNVRSEFNQAENWILEAGIGGTHFFTNCYGQNGSGDSAGTYNSWEISAGNNTFTGCKNIDLVGPAVYGPCLNGFNDTVASDATKNIHTDPFSTGQTNQTIVVNNSAGAIVNFGEGGSTTKTLTANDTTPSVNAYTAFSQTNTVTTNITAFDNSISGQEWYYRCNDSNTTFVHSGTFLMPNLGNVRAQSGRVYRFKRFGGATLLLDNPRLPAVSADRGDAAVTIQNQVDEPTQYFNTPLTTNRAVTLSTTGATGGQFRIVRSAAATGGSSLNVGTGPLKALAAGQWCDVEWNGSAWVLTAFGSL